MKTKIILASIVSVFLLAFTANMEQTWSPFTHEVQRQLTAYQDHYSPEKVYLQTDRPLYQPGEMIWFSTFIREADKRTAKDVSEVIYVELISPQGSVKAKQTLIALHGNVASGFQLQKSDAGGEYILRAYTNWMKNTDTSLKSSYERKIRVQKVVLPNLRMQLEFEREAYGAGATAKANLTLESLDNQPLRYHAFSFVAQLNGKQILTNTGKTDFDGKAVISLDLPKNLKTTDGLLNVKIDHKGQTESIARPIPITLQQIDVQFLPEGGNLVANIATNIAFKALDEFGKPADIAGTIFNEKDEAITTFFSLHDGMGKFNFTPQNNTQYYAKITKPFIGKEKITLPKVEANGLIMNVLANEKESISIQLKSPEEQVVTLMATAGSSVYFSKDSYINGTIEQTISTKEMPIGIVKITAFNLDKEPISERLFFANKHRQINIDIQTDKDQYAPRENVQLDLHITDEAGQPVQGNFNVAVADDQLLSFADDKAGNILASMLLESELKGNIHEPNFYFDKEEAQADAALDLLMLTHGWRRYVPSSPALKAVAELKPENLEVTKQQKEQATIAGRVLDADDQGIANATITITQNGTAETTTDSAGYFALKHIQLQNPTIGVKLAIQAEGYSTFYEIVNGFSTNNEFILSEGEGKLTGILKLDNGNTLPYFNFTLQQNEAKIQLQTDHEGAFSIQQLPAGNYELLANYKGYPSNLFQGIAVRSLRTTHVEAIVKRTETIAQEEAEEAMELVDNQFIITNFKSRPILLPKVKKKHANTQNTATNNTVVYDEMIMSSGSISLDNVVVMSYKVPLIQQDNTMQGLVVSSSDIRNLPVRNINSIATSVAGVASADNGDELSIRGSRVGGTAYYIDGIRVSGNLIPESEISQLQVITGGTDARYGGAEAVIPTYIPQGGKVPYRPAGDYGKEAVDMGMPDTGAGGSNGGGYYSYRHQTQTWRPRKIPQIVYAIVDEPAYLKSTKDDPKRQQKTQALMEEFLRKRFNYIINRNAYNSGHSVKIHFIIDKKGRITGANYWDAGRKREVRDKHFQQKMESMANWQAARKNGRPVASQYTVILERNNIQNKRVGNTKYRAPVAYYQPKFTPKTNDHQRTDFPATIFWSPNVQTDAEGKASLSFKTYDALTTFRITVEGLGEKGEIGRAEHTFFTQMPFALRAKMPTHILLSDLVKLPVILENNTDETISGILSLILPKALQLTMPFNAQQSLEAGESKTIYLPLKAIQLPIGEQEIALTFATKKHGDKLVQKVNIRPHGFPIQEVLTGQALQNDFKVNINDAIPHSLQAKLNVYPSMLDEVLATAEKLIRQPHGCFEQTSSYNYPNILALKLLRDGGVNKPAIEAKAAQVLDFGYKRLLGFEVKTGGFEWFGRPPSHEALTAYGLLEFNDMRAVYPVDEALIARTAEWLLSRRDGKGGWLLRTGGRGHWRADAPVRNAYILWALTEAGYGEQIADELEFAYDTALKNQDPYQLALVAMSMDNEGDERAEHLYVLLKNLQQADGKWAGKTTSITRSGSKNLDVETTSLATLALLRAEVPNNAALLPAIQFILSNRNYYGFGSTQATILGLKAIIGYAEQVKQDFAKAHIELTINGKEILNKGYEELPAEAMNFDNLAQYLQAGENTISVNFPNMERAIPFAVEVTYTSKDGKPSPACKVHIDTKLANTNTNMGETLRLTTTVTNTQNEALPNTTAIIGIPAGMSLQPWQLTALIDEKQVDYYELFDGKLVLHWVDMSAQERKTIHLDLKADVPGRYDAPASCAYLYYDNEVMSWGLLGGLVVGEQISSSL